MGEGVRGEAGRGEEVREKRIRDEAEGEGAMGEGVRGEAGRGEEVRMRDEAEGEGVRVREGKGMRQTIATLSMHYTHSLSLLQKKAYAGELRYGDIAELHHNILQQ